MFSRSAGQASVLLFEIECAGCALFCSGVFGAFEIFLHVHTDLGSVVGIFLYDLLVDGGFSLVVFLFAEHCGFLEKERGCVVGIVVRDLHCALVAFDGLGILLEVYIAVTFK